MTDQAQSNKGFELDAILAVQEIAPTIQVSVIDDEDGNSVSGFYIVSKNSVEYQNAANSVRIDNIKRNAKRTTQIDSSNDAGATQLANIVKSNERSISLAVVVGWYGFNIEGAAAAFDKSKVEKMFDARPTWQDKVMKALEADAGFIKV